MMAAIFIQPTFAQNDEKLFSGKPILTLFANYKAGVGHCNENSGFNLDRAFVGYEGFFTTLITQHYYKLNFLST